VGKNRLFGVLTLVALALVAGCSTKVADPRFTLRYDKGIDTTDLNALVARAGAGPVAVLDLGRTAWVSHHLAVVRDAEQPHYHRFHDLTVVVMRGQGVIEIEGKRFAMAPSDVVHVNRGVRHFFRNTGKEPAVAFVTFSPPFDGRDTVTAEVPAEPEKAPEPPKKKRWWWPFSRSRPEPKPAEPPSASPTTETSP
jgi:mannose-6-phosphate isomerase-like protein (cupin superfamily)